MITVAGIDVGKANLDVSVSGGSVVRFDNTTASITKLIKHLNDQDTALALCEPTGGYERLLTGRLRQAEIAEQVVHPGRVRAFAKACGYEAKTDPLDAQVLARYGEVFPEADTWEPETDPHCQELKDLLRRRRQFIDQRVQEKGRLDKGISTTIARSTKRHIAWLEKEIARLDKEYQAVLKDNDALAQRAALYRSVPGVGPLTAATLVAHLPELNRSQSEIYICWAGTIGAGVGVQLCGASLKDGATTAADFFPTVGQTGEEAAHCLPHRSPGAQAQISGCLLARPAPDGLVSIEIRTVAGQVHQAQVQAGRGQISPDRIAAMGWGVVPYHRQRFGVSRPKLPQEGG